MFIRLIKSSNEGFLQKVIRLHMYKTCIKSYTNITQALLLEQRFKNTYILYEQS